MADAKAEDIQELLGGALFKALYKWMVESGPVYLLPTGRDIARVDLPPGSCHGMENNCCEPLEYHQQGSVCRSCVKLPGGVRPGSCETCPEIHGQPKQAHLCEGPGSGGNMSPNHYLHLISSIHIMRDEICSRGMLLDRPL